MPYPLVSIVTPSYNSGDFLEQAIRSVTGQDYPRLEHLIIDGGSTDNSLALLQDCGPPVSWISEPDRGQADAVNKGFQRAQGEILGWLNADDTYRPGAIRAAVEFLQRHPGVDLVYGNFNYVDAQNRRLRANITPPFSWKLLLSGYAIVPQTSMFFRRSVLDRIGGLRLDLHYVLDWEFTLRIALACNIQRIAATWANFRITPTTKSVQQPLEFWPEVIGVLETLPLDGARVPPEQLGEGLFTARLMAGLEYARSGEAALARQQTGQAFASYPVPTHPAVLAAILFRAATQPWYNAYQQHPQAERALNNISPGLADVAVARPLLGYLYLYRALWHMGRGNAKAGSACLAQARTFLRTRDWLTWRTVRLAAGALFKA